MVDFVVFRSLERFVLLLRGLSEAWLSSDFFLVSNFGLCGWLACCLYFFTDL